jgi:hypothetical protein
MFAPENAMLISIVVAILVFLVCREAIVGIGKSIRV